jgi:hypothetical protein
MIVSYHPKVYECGDFIFYLEIWNGLPFIHMTLINFNHNIFKHMKAVVNDFVKDGVDLYGYGEEESTERLMKMAGFKETDLIIYNSNNRERRALCLQQQS